MMRGGRCISGDGRGADQKKAGIPEVGLPPNPELTLLLAGRRPSPERRAQFDRVCEPEPAA